MMRRGGERERGNKKTKDKRIKIKVNNKPIRNFYLVTFVLIS
jgi:hypothetical protein